MKRPLTFKTLSIGAKVFKVKDTTHTLQHSPQAATSRLSDRLHQHSSFSAPRLSMDSAHSCRKD